MKVFTTTSLPGITAYKIYDVSDKDKVSGYIIDDNLNDVYIKFDNWIVVDPISPDTIIKLVKDIEKLKTYIS